MAGKQIVILGGGVGGTLAANLLARKLNAAEAQITLVDEKGRHVYQPGYLYVPFGWAEPDALVRRERRLVDRRVRLLTERVIGIDVDRRKLALARGGKLPYDYLVIATGSQLDPGQVPGLKEGGHHFYSREAALRLRRVLADFQGGRVVIGVAGIPYKCPVAPLEFTFLLDWYLRRKGMRDRTELEYVSPLPRSFPIQNVADKATPWLEERGVTITIFFNVDLVDPENRTVSSIEGEELPYDLLVLVPPHRGARVLVDSGLADAPGGWVPTDSHTLKAKGLENIYVLGDATDLPISKSGSAAHFQAETLVKNLTGTLGRRSGTRL